MNDFSHIINLPHHVSCKRRQMPLAERAAQFSAFAALTGYDEDISEAARLTTARTEMAEDDIAELNAAFQHLLENESAHPTVIITYFQPDAHKSGGKYAVFSGVFRHYDAENKRLLFTDGSRISVLHICSILFV